MQALSKMILGFLLCAFSGVFSGLFAESLVEGKDYVVLDNALNVLKPSVAEIFNVGCPHCASMQQVLPSLFAVLKSDVEFLPFHIITGAPFSKQASEVLAVSFALDKAHKTSIKDSKSHFKRAVEAYFDANFKNRQRFKNAESFIVYGLNAAGIPQNDFDSILKDKATQEILKQWSEVAQHARIQGVPSFIINGKYLILAQNLKSQEDFIFKVDYLLGLD